MSRLIVGAGLAVSVSLALAAPAAAQVVTPDVTSELQTVRQVLDAPAMKAALQYVDNSDSETVRDWLAVCNAYGPQGDEIYRSRLIYKLFRIYGLEDVHIDDARNVIGIRRGVGGGPNVVLNAHHDNVALWPKEQPIEAFVADGRVWCPAAGDDLMGVAQLLSVLRAMNAGNIKTKGDVWFVTFTGEEVGSPGAEHFVRANYPQNLDWRRGDIIAQFHGGAGEGVSTGSEGYIHFSQLRVFVPLDYGRWRTDAVDALGPIITRVNQELRDQRSTQVGRETGGGPDMLQLNMPMVQGNAIHNGNSNEAWIRFDLRAATEERLVRADSAIQRIAAEVTHQMGPGFSYLYEVNMKLGAKGIDGWDKANNAAARMAAAASQALYGTRPVIDPTQGCGDCRRAYMGGMPAMSFRGSVLDYGDAGRFETQRSRPRLSSEVRRKTSGHDVTESAEVVQIWAGVKQGLLFATAYAGLAP
jgi:acetylornithine deacetylase/succinyl-diaminopimelate desuccinylase-like protein